MADKMTPAQEWEEQRARGVEDHNARMTREAEREWNAKNHRGRVTTQEMAVIEQVQMPANLPAGAQHPLEREPEAFARGLQLRTQNRVTLVQWLRDSLKRGTDFDTIHTVGKSKCSHGSACKDPTHWSKDQLLKPGAEKICGMLGVTPTFPNLAAYEQAALSGVEIRHVILRCHILSIDGRVVSEGIGARSLEKDYGDLNKSLKMAGKSAHIEATLRMAGLSEIFCAPGPHPPPAGTTDDDSVVPMGQFRGKRWQEVSDIYLQGLISSPKAPGAMKAGAKNELARRDAQDFDDTGIQT